MTVIIYKYAMSIYLLWTEDTWLRKWEMATAILWYGKMLYKIYFIVIDKHVIILLSFTYTCHKSSPYHLCLSQFFSLTFLNSHSCHKKLSQMWISDSDKNAKFAFVTFAFLTFSFLSFAFVTFAFLPGNQYFLCIFSILTKKIV